MRTKAQRIAAGIARRRAATRRARAFGTRVRITPKFSKTMRTRLIYAHPSGPAIRKAMATMKTGTRRTSTRKVNTVMNVNRATGTRSSSRLAGAPVELVSLNTLPRTRRVGKSKYNNLYNLMAGLKL